MAAEGPGFPSRPSNVLRVPFISKETFPRVFPAHFLSHLIGQNWVTCPLLSQSLARERDTMIGLDGSGFTPELGWVGSPSLTGECTLGREPTLHATCRNKLLGSVDGALRAFLTPACRPLHHCQGFDDTRIALVIHQPAPWSGG